MIEENKCGECRHFESMHYGVGAACMEYAGSCICMGFKRALDFNKSKAVMEAIGIVQKLKAKERLCAFCNHDLNKHIEQPYLPIDDLGVRGVERPCISYGCNCGDFK